MYVYGHSGKSIHIHKKVRTKCLLIPPRPAYMNLNNEQTLRKSTDPLYVLFELPLKGFLLRPGMAMGDAAWHQAGDPHAELEGSGLGTGRTLAMAHRT